MDISLQKLGKKFNREWIFRDINLNIPAGSRLAITGANGSGKSTLLKIIGGYSLATSGKVVYQSTDTPMESIHTSITLAAPYFNLVEELTLAEFLVFHGKFKNPIHPDEAVSSSGLTGALHKPIKDFSSGMKQRVKLIAAFCYENEIIMLDEPTSNLDPAGIQWFDQMYQQVSAKKSIIVASNLEEEIKMTESQFELKSF